MLNLLRRKKVAKKILWVLAALIIPAFVLWGAGSLKERRTNSPYKYIGTIEGKKIPFEKFIDSLAGIRIEIFLTYFNQPTTMTKLQGDKLLVNRLAWENLLVGAYARKEKITASDEEVVGFITRHPLFVRGDAFDNRLYEYILKHSLGTTPREFEEKVRGFIVNSKYKMAIMSAATASAEEVRRSYRNEFEKADLSYIIVEKDAFKDSLAVGANEIDPYYEEHKARFMELEKVVLQYIEFPHKEGEKEKALQNLKAAFEKLKAEPALMEETAKGLKTNVKETPPFTKNELIPGMEGIKQISSVAFMLRPVIDILPVVDENEEGTSYVIMVKEKIPSRLKAKNEVMSEIEDMLKDEKALALAKEKADEIYNDYADNKTSIEALAKKNGLELGKTKEPVTRFGYIEGIGESVKAVDEAFKLDVGEVSRPFEARKGYALISPVKLDPIDEKKFEEEKEEFTNKVLSTKKIRAFSDWLEEIKKRATLDVDMEML